MQYPDPSRCCRRVAAPLVLAGLLPGLLSVSPLLRAQSGLGLTRIVTSTTPLPSGGGNFGTFSTPVMEGNTVAFLALNGTQQGIYKWVGGTFSKVADLNTPMPNAGGNFTMFGQPSLSGSDISFFGQYVAGGIVLVQEGVYSAGTGGIIRIVDRTTPVPSGGGDTFSGFDSIPSVSNGITTFLGSGVSPSNWGVYRGNGGAPALIVGPGNAIPQGTGNFTGTVGSCLDGGTLAFKGLGSGGQQGIYLASGGTVSRIADKTTQVPSGTVNFKEFGFPVRTGGQTVFMATGTDDYLGIYLHNGASLVKVMDRNTPVPSTSNSTFAVHLDLGLSGETRVPVDSNGNVVFTGGGGYYLYTASTGTIALIMRGDSHIDDQPAPPMYFSEKAISARKIAMLAYSGNLSSALYLVEPSSYARSVSGPWDTAANWSFNAVPGPESSTLLSTGVNVTGPAAAVTVRSLEVTSFIVPIPSTLTLQNGGPLTATEGAIVGGNSILAGNGSLTAGAGKSVLIRGSAYGRAVLSPGDTAVGTITIGGKLAFGEDSDLRIDLSTAGACDVVNVTGDLDLTSGLGKRIVFVTGPGGASGSDYTFLTYSGTRTGTFFPTDMPAGYTIDYSTPGQIFLKAPPVTDSDHDGIPDAWELAQAGNLTTLTATGDADSDGFSDVSEYIADTGALNASEFLQITDFHTESYIEPDPDDPDAPPYEEVDVFVTWTSRAACSYSIETADSPGGPWTLQNENITGGDGIVSNDFYMSPIPGRLFLRVTASR